MMNGKPSPQEQEILDLIQEECGELIQIISKVRRWGFDSVYQDKSNQERLAEELLDLTILIELLVNKRAVFTKAHTESYILQKTQRLMKYTTVFEEEPIKD